MKKILVPVDYSASADNAVCYAIHLAKTIKANIHLVHGINVPELSPMSGLVVWPLEDYSTIKQEADDQLTAYTNQLQKTHQLNNSEIPLITYSSEIGTVKQVVDQLIELKKFDMVVMGLSGIGNIEKFFMGSNSRDLIANTKIPVLLIPKNVSFIKLKKIGFATDLSLSDINNIHQLTGLFVLFNADILLVHISEEPKNGLNKNVDRFLNDVTCKINYSKIYYRHIEESDVEQGLIWLAEHTQIDLLTMIHRKSTLFKNLTTGSYTQKMAQKIELPLLVMPEV